MATTEMVRARIDKDVKDEAVSVLKQMGLTLSDLVRVAVTRVAVEKALPFEIKIPNAETRAAMAEVEAMALSGKGFNNAKELFDVLEQEASR